MLDVNNIYAFKKHEDKHGSGGSISFAGIHNTLDSDAGKLKKIILVVFSLFSMLILADYFLTVFAINRHFNEFNPLTVSIWENFENPEIMFLLLKLFVIGMNGLLIYLLWKLSEQKPVLKKVMVVYLALAAVFAFLVVVYDIGIITETINIEGTILQDIIILFFKSLGMI